MMKAGALSGELQDAPDWMIEIVSPGQSQTVLMKKIMHCLEQGTQLAGLIDPAERWVFGYTPDLRSLLYQKPEAQLPVPAFAANFELTVGELVAWLYA